MKLLISLIALVVAVSAAPQSVNSQDAELLPSDIDTGFSSPSSPGSGGLFPGGFDVHFFTIPDSRATRPSIFDLLFRHDTTHIVDEGNFPEIIFGPSEATNDSDVFPVTSDGFPSFFNSFFGGSFFPSILGQRPNRPVPSLPVFPDIFSIPDLGDIPNGYDNTTHEVKVVNGTRYEVNRTVTTDNEGHVVFTQVLMSLTPDGDGSGIGGETPDVAEENPIEPVIETTLEEADPAFNQDTSTVPLVRRRRWIIDWLKSLRRPKVKSNALPLSLADEGTGLRQPLESFPKPDTSVGEGEVISYAGDTDVNYIGPKLRDNPDAEVFDVKLVRADADRFFAMQPQPFGSQPLRSKPLRRPKLKSIAQPLSRTDTSAELRQPLDSASKPETSDEEAEFISYAGDTDINYIGPKLRDNPDAEIFDVELVRADADRFFERQPRTFGTKLRSESQRSRPLRFQTMGSQPKGSQSRKSRTYKESLQLL